MKIDIQGDTWTCSALNTKKYENKYGDDSLAMTLTDKKTIDFNKKSFTIETVRHELFHVFHYGLYLGSAEDLNKDDYEEILAEMVSNNLEKMIRISNKIYKELK